MSQNLAVRPISSIFINKDLCTNVGTGNNTFVFTFQRNVQTTDSSRISVSNFSVPYSWFNITAARKNNQYKYVWYDANSGSPDFPAPNQVGGAVGTNGGTVFTVTMPNGYYDVTTLNAYLQFVMIQNGHYLVDQNGNYVYFLEWEYNVSLYRLQFNTYQLPNALPAGWTNPAGVIAFVDTLGTGNIAPWYDPKFLLYDQSNGFVGTTLFKFFGFLPVPLSTLPSSGLVCRILPSSINQSIAKISILGDEAPQQTPDHSVCLSCSMVDNPLRSSKDNQVSTFIVTTQNVSVSFGNDIVNSNFFTTWIPLVQNQQFRTLTFQLTSQDGTLLNLEDVDTSIELLLTDLRYA